MPIPAGAADLSAEQLQQLVRNPDHGHRVHSALVERILVTILSLFGGAGIS